MLPVPSASPSTKLAFVLDELLQTEATYVAELESLLRFYVRAFSENVENVPAVLRGKEDVIFGNLAEIAEFHSKVFLKDLQGCREAGPGAVARCFLERRECFYAYVLYCQNKPNSEALRQNVGESCAFFQVGTRWDGKNMKMIGLV